MNCPSCGKPDLDEKQLFCPSCRTFISKPKHAHQASVSTRAMAFLIDFLMLWGTPFIILYALNVYITGKLSLTAIFYSVMWEIRGASANFMIFLSIIGFLIWIAFIIYFILQLAKGWTPGKKYFNLRVEKVDGSHVDFWTMFIVREIWGRLVSTVPIFLGYFWMLWDEKAQTWHDKIANTVVLQLSKTAVEREKKRKKQTTGGIMISMRDNAAAILFFLLLFFVLSIAFSGGLGGANIIDDVVAFITGEAQRGVVAQINGQPIRYEDYSSYYNNKMKEYREKNGSDPEGYQLEQFEDGIWNELVNTILVTQYIEKNGLQATDEEVVFDLTHNPPQDIRSIEAFQTNGVFDMSLYLQAWSNTGDPQLDYFWAQMDARARHTIPRQKLNERILSTVRMTEDELKDEYLKRHQEVSARYVMFDPNKYSSEDITVSDNEIKAYYDEHPDEFKEKAKRRVAYVTFSTVPTAKDTQAVREQAMELLGDAKSGLDFEKLATDYSEDKGSAQKGGDLGYFGQGAMVKPFEEAAFAANVGDILGPVESRFGLHIIKVEDKKTEDGEEKVRARHILLKFDASDETISFAVKSARYFAETVREEPFSAVVQRENFKIDTTAYFQEGGFIPGIGRNMKASKFVFQKMVGTISHPYKYREGYFVFKIIDAQEEQLKTLDDVKAQITSRVKHEKQEEAASQACLAFREKMQDLDLATAAARDSLQLNNPKPFSRSGYVEGGPGRDAAFVGVAFGLDEGLVSKPVKGLRGYYIIEVLKKIPFSEQDFDIKRDQLWAEVMREKQQRIYGAWFQAVKDNATIKDYRDIYFL